MTQHLQVETEPPYSVHVGEGVLGELPRLVEGRRIAVVTDRNVERLHLPRLGALAEAPRHVLEPGEGSKSLVGLGELLDFLLATELDRTSLVVAFGGGVVGDLSGLAASLFMRGIGVLQCPTTLLSQVDSAIGGKTGINLRAGKNLAGTFHQPRAVLADPSLLATLSPDEFQSGLGEVMKSALVGDAELLALLERSAAELLARDPGVLAEVIARCCRVKAGVVTRDERESGERKLLNLGHTFAHAIEHLAGYGHVPHGIAVGTGLALAVEASRAAGTLEDTDLPGRVSALLAALGLPPTLGDLRARYAHDLPGPALIEAMRHDKKGRAGEPAFVLVERAGRAVADRHVDGALLADLLA